MYQTVPIPKLLNYQNNTVKCLSVCVPKRCSGFKFYLWILYEKYILLLGVMIPWFVFDFDKSQDILELI